uniref:RNA polymerase sigma factor RpoD n=1 Tax=Parastrongyloides trichosuri TaxID=131310 RepID=A0A0N4ZZU8_PARTI
GAADVPVTSGRTPGDGGGRPGEGGEREQCGGDREGPAEARRIDDRARDEGAQDAAQVARHRVPGDHAAAAPLADDIGQDGLLPRVHERGSRARDQHDPERHPDRLRGRQRRVPEGGDRHAGDEQRAASEPVVPPAGGEDQDRIARRVRREHPAGERGLPRERRGDEQRDHRDAHAERRPAEREHGGEERPVARDPQCLAEAERGLGVGAVAPPDDRGSTEREPDHGGGDHERGEVEDEGGAQAEARDQRAEHGAQQRSEQEPGGVDARDSSAGLHGAHLDEQRRRRDREHRRSDTAGGAQHQELRIAVREGAGTRREGDDEDARRIGAPFAEAAHDPARQRGGDEAHERERADDGGRREVRHAEGVRVLRDRRSDHAVAERDREPAGDEGPDLERESGLRIAGHRTSLVAPRRVGSNV